MNKNADMSNGDRKIIQYDYYEVSQWKQTAKGVFFSIKCHRLSAVYCLRAVLSISIKSRQILCSKERLK